MLIHVGDVLTAMGKHSDGKVMATEASELLRSEHVNKGYLQYLTESVDEVSARAYAMEAMEVLSVKIMSMFKCHRQRNTVEWMYLYTRTMESATKPAKTSTPSRRALKCGT